MRRSIFPTKLIGPLLAAIVVAMIFNADNLRAMALPKSYALIYVSGPLALTAALAIVNAHTEWSTDWRIATSLIGWLAVIGGIILITLSRVAGMIGDSMVTTVFNGRIMGEGIVLLVVGAWPSSAGNTPGNT